MYCPTLLRLLPFTVLAACNPSDPPASATPPQRICTQIGCEDQLSVELRGNVPAQFTLRVTGGGQTREVVCNETACRQHIVLAGFTPAEARVEVVTAAGTNTRTVTLAYRNVQPNGPDCPPICRQAVVTVEL